MASAGREPNPSILRLPPSPTVLLKGPWSAYPLRRRISPVLRRSVESALAPPVRVMNEPLSLDRAHSDEMGQSFRGF
jgi:hypothetical protein